MTLELRLLAWTVVLGIVQLLLAAMATTAQNGLAWSAGARDEKRPPEGVAARLHRAQSNLMETFPFFAAVILAAHLAGREGAMTAWGAQIYFWGRVVYLPLYAAGVPWLRSIVWAVSMLGLALVLLAVLLP
ncbi:MAPEG family protein [Roseomonas gilardii subsp. gilardii]|uniref:MAPEG family protein n=1 Tax=Roseomonas gilardii TaxID=257708 RepID=UPI001FFB3BB4|nr:MAPEG family protein [Roseomonas gilardii]UPG71980.1 MAPEG family protein [Roseomonas gilardii subsp. gilardii]